MKIYTIDYKKHRGNDGTVYKQTIKIDEDLKNKYNSELQKNYNRIKQNTVINNHDMNIIAYTEKLKKGINYLHITWLRMFFDVVVQNKINSKNRLRCNRNTIIEVI